MPIASNQFEDSFPNENRRCVAVIDRTLPIGKAANAAAVMALTMGANYPALVGDSLTDGADFPHPGLIPIGIPILGADAEELPRVRAKALRAEVEVVDFPTDGQQTNDYGEFRRLVRGKEPDALAYLGVMLLGERKQVSKIVGKYSLLE